MLREGIVMKINPLTLNDEDIATIIHILNRGNEVNIKQERDKVVIIEVKRFVAEKRPIIEM